MPHIKGNKFKPNPPSDDTNVDNSDVNNRKRAREDAGVATPTETQKRTKKKKPTKDKPFIPTVIAPAPKGKAALKSTASSNWETLKAVLEQKKKKTNPKTKKPSTQPTTSSTPSPQLTRVLALDCEMVGVGKRGDRSILARVSIVNSTGGIIYDSYVAPTEVVTDYRTKWSGIRPSNLKDAPSFEDVRSKVRSLLRGRVLVGHAIHNDLDVLGIQHPESDIRDTSRYPPLMKVLSGGRSKPRALRQLAQEHLTIDIQSAEHCPIEDARAALGLYTKHRKEWEQWLAGGGVVPKPMPKNITSLPKYHRRLAGVGELLGSDRLTELAKADYMADL